MARRKKLKWGETPFDKMDRDQLIRFAQASYAALESTRSCLAMSRAVQPESLYWSERGSGGRALFQADKVIGDIESRFTSETIYRAFFRYARDLLFPGLEPNVWMVCDKDAVMTKSLSGHNDGTCADCGGMMRPMTWADLTPTSPLGAPS